MKINKWRSIFQAQQSRVEAEQQIEELKGFHLKCLKCLKCLNFLNLWKFYLAELVALANQLKGSMVASNQSAMAQIEELQSGFHLFY